ncbi:MAG: hypothetical protein K2O05_01840, partial [Anaeroplasmataceae bacterium]|nr:hypothetical protein [Anaeroplasmataceae bacterium]
MLGNGKKVLFVSEKQAALNVVYENLKRVGLDSFALELHSHKANKKEFIDELYKTANLPQYDIQNEAFDMEKKYSELEEQLKEYRSVLHQIVPRLNMSLYDIFARYLSLERPSFVYPIESIENKSKEYLDSVLDLLHQYKLASDSLGYDYRYSPFYGFSCLDTNYIRYKAKDNFELLLSFFEDKLDTINDINKKLPLHLVSYQDLVSKVPFLSNFVGLNYFLPDYFNKNNRNNLLDTLETYLETKEYLEKSTLDRFFDLNILKEDVTKFTYDFKLASSYKLKWFKPSYHKLKKQINLYTKIKMRDSDLVLKLSEALEYLKKEELYNQSLNNLPSGYRPYEYELIYQDLCNLKDIPFDLDLTLESYRELKSRCLDILVHFKERNQLNLEEYTSLFDSSVINLVSDDLVKVTKILKKMNDQIDLLPVHAQRIDILTELSKLDCLVFLNKAIEEKVNLNHLGAVYESLFLKANLYYEIDQYAILRKFTGLAVDELIAQFKRLSKVHLDANKAMIISKLSKQRPDGSILAGTEFAVLIKEFNKSRRQKPIRLLLEEISSLILTIKPVFLMSPLSVSTYLKSELNMFDIVIFDEASQVFAWDAVGAIYRAKQCIIIGDSKQMPPSNFFNAIMNDEEEDNYDNDLESILDQGSSSFMTKRLNWHYRSRSEELIAFSNKAFYDSSLITIPQAKSHSKGFGVDYVYVNGIYEARLRCNHIEAKTIVKLVFEHFDQNPKQSLGVVAFSNVQADLIAAMIEDYLNEHQEYASFFKEDLKEPFFVKNLETVQGDERDRIIFSICFGYNKDHQFYQRFGPLNNLGGERRLNVAITRAKYNITVVSSIHASDIRLENTDSLGVKLLKEYLDYAEHVTTPSLVEAKVLDSSIEVIASYIESLGFLVEKSIGSSGFKIDIAVKHPLTQEYVVAIMLDGKTYCLGSCSDANYLQELLLNRLGWNYYRIFMPLWFEHEVEQKEKLKKYLNHLFNHAKIHKEEQLTNSKSYLVESKEEFDDCFEAYQAVTDEKIKSLYQSKTTAQIINYIVKKEEPIHEEYLLKRICFMYGRTKVTNIVRELFLADLNKLNLLKENDYLMSKEIGP